MQDILGVLLPLRAKVDDNSLKLQYILEVLGDLKRELKLHVTEKERKQEIECAVNASGRPCATSRPRNANEEKEAEIQTLKINIPEPCMAEPPEISDSQETQAQDDMSTSLSQSIIGTTETPTIIITAPVIEIDRSIMIQEASPYIDEDKKALLRSQPPPKPQSEPQLQPEPQLLPQSEALPVQPPLQTQLPLYTQYPQTQISSTLVLERIDECLSQTDIEISEYLNTRLSRKRKLSPLPEQDLFEL